MIDALKLVAWFLASSFKSWARLGAEILILRHHPMILRRKAPARPRPSAVDRLILIWLSRLRPSGISAVTVVRPETVVRWHRYGFRLYWRWKSHSRGGRPPISLEVRQLIREISLANPLWGAPRNHGELLKLGVGARSRRWPGTWRMADEKRPVASIWRCPRHFRFASDSGLVL